MGYKATRASYDETSAEVQGWEDVWEKRRLDETEAWLFFCDNPTDDSYQDWREKAKRLKAVEEAYIRRREAHRETKARLAKQILKRAK